VDNLKEITMFKKIKQMMVNQETAFSGWAKDMQELRRELKVAIRMFDESVLKAGKKEHLYEVIIHEEGREPLETVVKRVRAVECFTRFHGNVVIGTYCKNLADDTVFSTSHKATFTILDD
jgi:hypothetical protein